MALIQFPYDNMTHHIRGICTHLPHECICSPRRGKATATCFHSRSFFCIGHRTSSAITPDPHRKVSGEIRRPTSRSLCANPLCWRSRVSDWGHRCCPCPETSGCQATTEPSRTATQPHEMPRAHKEVEPQMTSIMTRLSEGSVHAFALFQ